MNVTNILEFDRILNFIVSKNAEYELKKLVIERFINHGEQFIYVKRYKTDLEEMFKFFSDVLKDYPGHSFQVRANTFYMDDQLIGHFIPLNTFQREKSNEYPKVTTIIYKGFMRKSEHSRYLNDEPRALLNLMDTVFRNRNNVRCICFDNHINLTNPYFLYFGFTPDIYQTFTVTDDIYFETDDLELIENECIYEHKPSDYKGLFIDSKTLESKYAFSIEIDKTKYGVWMDKELIMLFVSAKLGSESVVNYTIKTNEINNLELFQNGWKREYELIKMVSAFKRGILMFENEGIRNQCYEMFREFQIW